VIIGVDFDNTLVSYDHLLYTVALERGLITPEVERNKKAIRDRVRRTAEGDVAWQKLQTVAYGVRIGEAQLIEGVAAFFEQCRRTQTPVYIISHKTEFAGYAETPTNLRAAAMGWMETHGFFDAADLGLDRANVFFGATRAEKIERVRTAGCTHFIDDLEETFLEPAFPAHVQKILFAPDDRPALPGVTVARTWQAVHEQLFAGA
jgi:hypothetical protein